MVLCPKYMLPFVPRFRRLHMCPFSPRLCHCPQPYFPQLLLMMRELLLRPQLWPGSDDVCTLKIAFWPRGLVLLRRIWYTQVCFCLPFLTTEKAMGMQRYQRWSSWWCSCSASFPCLRVLSGWAMDVIRPISKIVWNPIRCQYRMLSSSALLCHVHVY